VLPPDSGLVVGGVALFDHGVVLLSGDHVSTASNAVPAVGGVALLDHVAVVADIGVA